MDESAEQARERLFVCVRLYSYRHRAGAWYLGPVRSGTRRFADRPAQPSSAQLTCQIILHLTKLPQRELFFCASSHSLKHFATKNLHSRPIKPMRFRLFSPILKCTWYCRHHSVSKMPTS